jgi:CBS-domain-containing membrane protein
VHGAEAEAQALPGHVGDHACGRFIAARPEERLAHLLDRMDDAAVKRAVVIDARGELVGVLSLTGELVVDVELRAESAPVT